MRTSLPINSLPAALCAAALFAIVGQARAIDRYNFRVLPSMGFGAHALGADYEAQAACGYMNDPSGDSHPCVWRNLDNPIVQALPEMGGAEGQANACMDEEDFPFAVVGTMQNANGAWKPVLWVEVSPGEFSLVVLPTVGGAQGSANALYLEEENGGLLRIVGTTRDANGRDRATLWIEMTPGVFEAKNLGTFGGNKSEAVAIVQGLTGGFGDADLYVYGRAQMPDGAWHAARWDFRFMSGPEILDFHPGGVSSAYTGASMFHDTYGPMACGSRINANGRSRGFFDTYEQGTDLMNIGVHNDGEIYGITGHEMTHGVRMIGSVWNQNNPNNRTAVVLNVPDVTVIPNLYAAAQIDPACEGLGVRFTAAGQFIIVGFMDYTDDACMFLADGTEAPDVIAVSHGDVVGKLDETKLFRVDDVSVKIKTDNGSGDLAEVVLPFFGIEGDSPTLEVKCQMNIVGGASATAQANVSLWNFMTNAWDAVGTQTLVGLGSYAAEFAPPTLNHINPSTGEVRMRVRAQRTSGNVRGFEFDYASLARR